MGQLVQRGYNDGTTMGQWGNVGTTWIQRWHNDGAVGRTTSTTTGEPSDAQETLMAACCLLQIHKIGRRPVGIVLVLNHRAGT